MKRTTISLLFISLLFSCGQLDKKAELEKLRKEKSEIEAKIAVLEDQVGKADTTAEAKKTDVSIKALQPATFRTYIEVQGKVDAEESVSLSTEIPGTITRIYVKSGDHVTKGQVLAETDSRAMQQQIMDLQTNLDLAKQVYEKQKSLWDQKIGTEMQYLQSKTTKESLENKMAAMQEQIRMSRIVSPIDGTVDAVNIKIGQAVMPGLPSISVINFSNLKIKADVAENYAGRIKNGNEVLVVFPDTQDSLRSTVSYAARGINPLTRTFGVEVLLDTKKELHPNMVTKLRINDYQSPQPELIVPVKYIQKGTEEQFVMVAENGIATKKKITTGREYSGNTVVTSGLKSGDLLITEGYDLVNEGDRVAFKK
jgi:membrane fusion protein, multidrug efflux system